MAKRRIDMKHLMVTAAFCAALSTTAAFASGGWDYDNGRIQGSGIVRSQDRTVSSFTSMELEGSGDVTLSQGLVRSVSVETDDNVLRVVRTEVVGGVLHLGFQPGTRIGRITRLSFRITAPAIEAITISGSGDVRTATAFHAQAFQLHIGGSGNIDASVSADTVRAEIAGSGDITVDGRASQLSVSIDGSGSLRARGLQTASTDVQVNGSGSVDVTASDTVVITINGSGDVTYGGGARATVRSSGSGTARQR
jgi:hypothetical protein